MKNIRIVLIILVILFQMSRQQQQNLKINKNIRAELSSKQPEELTDLSIIDTHNMSRNTLEQSYKQLYLNTNFEFKQQTEISSYQLSLESLKNPMNTQNKFVLIELSLDPQYLTQDLSTSVRLCLSFNSIDNITSEYQDNLLSSHANDINYLATAPKCDISDIWAWKEQSYKHSVSFEFLKYFDSHSLDKAQVYISVYAQSLSSIISYTVYARTSRTLPCPNNCSSKINGMCDNNTGICHCNQGMTGGDCSVVLNKITNIFNSILLHSETTQMYYATLGKSENQPQNDDKLQNINKLDDTNNSKTKNTLTQLIFNLALSQPQTVVVIYVLISSYNDQQQPESTMPYPSYSNSNYYIQLTKKNPKFTLYDIQADCYRIQENTLASQNNHTSSPGSSCILGISFKQLNSQNEAVISLTITTQDINSSMEHSTSSYGSVLGLIVIITVTILISFAIVFCIIRSLCFKIIKKNNTKQLQKNNNNKDKSINVNNKQGLQQELNHGAKDYSKDGFPPLQEVKKAPSPEQIIYGVKNRLKSQSFAKQLQPKKQLLQQILMPMEVYTAFTSGVPTERIPISGRLSNKQNNLDDKQPTPAAIGTPCTTEAIACAGSGTSGPNQTGQSRSCCSVCFAGFVHNQNYQRTICGHIFHPKCLSTWMISSDDCPLCRQSFEFIQIIDFLTKASKNRCVSMEERTSLAIQRSLLIMQFIKQDEKLIEMSDEQFIQQFYIFLSDSQKAIVDENNAFKKKEDPSKYITLPTTVSESLGDNESCKEDEKQNNNYDEESLKSSFFNNNQKYQTQSKQMKAIKSLVHSADLDKTNNAEETKGNIVENTNTKSDMSFRLCQKTQDSNITNCSMLLSKKQLQQLNQQQTQDQDAMTSKSSSKLSVEEDKNCDIDKKKNNQRREILRQRQQNQQKKYQMSQVTRGSTSQANDQILRLPTEEAAIDQ